MTAALLPSIDTPRLRLRRVAEGDLDDLLLVNGDQQTTRYLPYRAWLGVEAARSWLERMRGLMAGGDTEQFVLQRRDDGRVIGSCLVFRIDRGNRRAEIGYVLGRAHWGQGLMGEALRGFITQCFETLDLHRLEASVDPRNTASTTLLERLGFQCEGLLRERWWTDGEAADSAMYGLLRREWR